MTNVHNIFKGKLLKVDELAVEIKAKNIRLILQSEKFDRGLEQMVLCSQAVKLNEDHLMLSSMVAIFFIVQL